LNSFVPISVAIPTLGSSLKLRASLERILQCRPLPAEIILHLDGAPATDEPALPESTVPVKILRSGRKIGPGGGRDACIRAASNDLVASFDDDSWPLDEDYFAKACVVMSAFPEALVLSPAVYIEEVPVSPTLAEVNEVRCFEGSASVTRRSLYLTLPGYVPVPQAYGIEEADLSLQAHAAGLQVLSCPWFRAWHDRPQSDHLHAEPAWIKNEVLLGYLRFPAWAQPWAWWRAVRRAWRISKPLGAWPCLSALLDSIPHCAEYSPWKRRYSHHELRRALRLEPRRWTLKKGTSGLELTPSPKARRIILAQYTNPSVYPPLEHISKILSRRGWEVICLGLHGRAGLDLDWPARLRVTVRRMNLCAPGIWQKVHYLRFLLWVLWTARSSKAEWVYLSDQLATPLFSLLRRLGGVSVAYHEHDSPPNDGYADGLFIAKVLRDRLTTARECDVLVLPNAMRLQALVQASGRTKRSFAVWNCPSLDEVGESREAIADQRELRVLYHGSIGPSGFPQWLLEGIMKVNPAVRVNLVGYVLPSSENWALELKQLAEQRGFGDRFDTLEAMPRWRLLRHTRTQDIGLGVLSIDPENINLRFLAGASNKVFDYLAHGIVPIVLDLPEWRELLIDRGCAVGCHANDPDSLAKAISQLVSDPNEMRKMGETGRQHILKEWNYEAQFAPVLELLESTPHLQRSTQ
jgi:glycosyltransferase involved in cell wall biosynthesis